MRRSCVALSLVLLALPAALPAAGLTPTEHRIAAAVDERQTAAIELLARAVDIPSATENLAGVKQVGDLFAAELESLGFVSRWVALPAAMGRAGHLVAEHAGTRKPRILLIGHLDTVLEGEPFRREGNRGFGSGTSDMKGGDVVLLEALRALHAAGELEDLDVKVVMTGDEEKPGEPLETTRQSLIEAARRSDVALAFEGSVRGSAVVGRRGISGWRLEVEGVQGHSSSLFGAERGSGAIYEAARILTAFHDTLQERYLTFNPGVILGGTEVSYDEAQAGGSARGKTNVVARKVIAAGDLRYLTVEQRERARAGMRAIVATHLPRTSASISFSDGYPSMAPDERHRGLLRQLDQVSRDLGGESIGEHDPGKRGAGDVAFVADRLASLDGLGALGDLDHAPGEWVDLDELPLLTRRTALLIYRLTR